MLKKTVTSFDKTKIAFNYFKKDGSNNLFIICHGFAMSKDAKLFLDLSKDLFKICDVITMDQRGHGESGGVFNFSANEHKDIKAVIDYAQESYKHIFLMGFSIGAASSIIEVAKEKNVHGLIAVSPPISFETIENNFLDKDALIPGIQKIGRHTFKMRIGNIFAEKIRPIDIIDQVSPIPLLIIHGDRDPIIFKHHAEALYKKAKQPKKLIIVKKGLHAEDLYHQNPKDFISLCILWLKTVSYN